MAPHRVFHSQKKLTLMVTHLRLFILYILKSFILCIIENSHDQPTALEALQCGPSTDSEKRYFRAKTIRSLEKTQILALKMAIFQKCGPRVDLGWPWLIEKKVLQPLFLFMHRCIYKKIN
jgi:hypothetical protein